MRQCMYMTFARIFLILSLIKFARAAPVVARGVHEVRVNAVDVAEDGTATSQKRWDSGPRDDWLALANMADQTSAPTAPQLPDLVHSESGPHSPRSSTRLSNAPSSSALSTGPHPRSKEGIPPPSSRSPNYSPIPKPDQSFTSSPKFALPRGWSATAGPSGPSGPSGPAGFSSPSWLPADNSRPPSPDFSWPSHVPAADNSRPPSPDFSWPSHVPAADNARPPSPDFSWPSHVPAADNARPPSPDFSWQSHVPAADNSRPPSPDFSWPSHVPAADNSHPPIPDGYSSTGLHQSADNSRPPIPDGYSSTGLHQSADNHPQSSSEPPRPTEPETKDYLSRLGAGPSHFADFETKDFLSQLLKGKIKRRNSGSGAVNSAQDLPVLNLIPSQDP